MTTEENEKLVLLAAALRQATESLRVAGEMFRATMDACEIEETLMMQLVDGQDALENAITLYDQQRAAWIQAAQ